MKKFISILLIITVMVSLCACSNTGSNAKITIGVLEPVTTLDPVNASSLSEKIVANNCFEGLLRLDDDGNITLGGAVRYSVSGDDLTYTFKLNETAQWYIPSQVKKDLRKIDYNTSVTAADYVFGLERYKSSGKADFDNVSVMEATDDYTLVIKLQKPDIDFLHKLATLPLYPCNETIYNGIKDNIFTSAEYTPCNGAYYINVFSKSETILERNKDYSGNLQIFNRYVSLYTTGSKETLKERFLDKTYDLYFAPSTAALEGIEPTARSISTVWGLAFNMNTAEGSNDTIRTMLLSAVSTESITAPSFAFSTAQRIIPDSYLIGDTQYANFNPEALSYPYDTDKGTALLSEISEGTVYTIDFAVPVEMKESADTLVQEWTDLYANVFNFNVTTFEPSETQSVADAGNYDLAILPLFPKTNTAYGVLESLCGAPCYASRESFIKTYDTLPDYDTIAEDFKAAEKYVLENGIFVPLFTESNDIYSTPELTGVYSVNGGQILYLNEGIK